LAALLGLALVQRLVPAAIRQEQNDVAGFIYAVLGVIYAVLLALVVIATWEEFGRARITVEAEANALPRSSGSLIGSLNPKGESSRNSANPMQKRWST
jgi:hypothetical protein